jgi:hypothetical protein
MTERSGRRPHIVAIGGVGGSGTRLGAALLQMLGYYIGDDLNDALDNLWFTLLFKRRSILLECESDLSGLIALFFSRMSGETNFSEEQRARVLRLAHDERLQHPQSWLAQRAESFLRCTGSGVIDRPWGWKEPNSHIIIDHLFERRADLHYIHFTRHPIDMALSANQNQLQNWGPIILNRDVANEPRESLAYWCAAHRRVSGIMQRYAERTMVVDYDRLCIDPTKEGVRVARFLDVSLSDEDRARFCDLIDPDRQSSGRFRTTDLAQFMPDDIDYVRKLGYAM